MGKRARRRMLSNVTPDCFLYLALALHAYLRHKVAEEQQSDKKKSEQFEVDGPFWRPVHFPFVVGRSGQTLAQRGTESSSR